MVALGVIRAAEPSPKLPVSALKTSITAPPMPRAPPITRKARSRRSGARNSQSGPQTRRKRRSDRRSHLEGERRNHGCHRRCYAKLQARLRTVTRSHIFIFRIGNPSSGSYPQALCGKHQQEHSRKNLGPADLEFPKRIQHEWIFVSCNRK